MISSDPGFGLYVHWPFCRAKCPYCDFNSHVRHEAVDSTAFAWALVQEMRWFSSQTSKTPLTSIFFGGGTPSLMPPAAVAQVIEAAQQLWGFAPGIEISLEANPTSVEASHFRGYRSAGVNRVSVGVQALQADDLATLGRQHTPQEALQAFRLAASIFPRVSFDMIYARPGQNLASWRAELAQALCEQQGHMSLYQLTIEPGTRYFDLVEHGRLIMLAEEPAAALYDLTQEMTAAAGLTAYEVSNHAAPGHESRHNLLYWHYGRYVGIGPGAHGRIGRGSSRIATATERHPESWRSLVEKNGHGVVEQYPVTLSEQAQEYLLMGLRLTEGIDIGRYESLAGRKLDPASLAPFEALGLIRRTGASRLAATSQGRRVLNSLIVEIASL